MDAANKVEKPLIASLLSMNKQELIFSIDKKEWLSPHLFLLSLRSDIPLDGLQAGQFVNVLTPFSPHALRRPFSLCDALEKEILLMIKSVGKGSSWLSEREVGEEINVLLPLGNGFTFSTESEKKFLLVGGGVGMAPLFFLGKTLRKAGHIPSFLLGGRGAEDLALLSEFAALGEVFTSTENGSHGEEGLVTQHSLWEMPLPFDAIYTCGPLAMMKAIAQLAAQRDIPCEVSLENTMACGFGVCLCCVVETVEGNRCTCTEGPVFNAKDLAW